MHGHADGLAVDRVVMGHGVSNVQAEDRPVGCDFDTRFTVAAVAHKLVSRHKLATIFALAPGADREQFTVVLETMYANFKASFWKFSEY